MHMNIYHYFYLFVIIIIEMLFFGKRVMFLFECSLVSTLIIFVEVIYVRNVQKCIQSIFYLLSYDDEQVILVVGGTYHTR